MSKREKDALDRIAETEEEREVREELAALMKGDALKNTLAEHGLDEEKARARMKDIIDRASGANVVRPARWWTSRAAIGLGVAAAAAAIILILSRRGDEDVPVASRPDAGVQDAAADGGDAP